LLGPEDVKDHVGGELHEFELIQLMLLILLMDNELVVSSL